MASERDVAALAGVLAAHLMTYYPGEVMCDCEQSFTGEDSRAGDSQMIAAHCAHVAAAVRASDVMRGIESRAAEAALREAAERIGHSEDCPMDPDRDPYIGCRCRMSLVWARADRLRDAREAGR